MATHDRIFAAEQALRGDLDGWLHDHTEQEGECLIWQGGLNSARGVPIMRLPCALPAKPGRATKTTVQRVVWEEVNGKPLNQAWRVWTTCGEKKCVNPAHVRAGTSQQMIDFKTRMGCFKMTTAEIAKRAKASQSRSHLTWADIRAIRAEMEATPILQYSFKDKRVPDGVGRIQKAKELAARYNLSARQIDLICRGYQWREQFSDQNPFSQILRLAA